MNNPGFPLTDADSVQPLWVDEVAGTASRKIFTDESIYQQEQQKVFAKSWLFLAHESELSNNGDYVLRHLSNDPVLVVRGQDGKVRAFHNSCPHRGAMLCRSESGFTKTFRCPYHGWVFGLDGKILSSTYPPEVVNVIGQGENLKEMAQVATYAGLVFGTWNSEALSLEAYLGDSRFYIDMFVRRTPAGMEVLGPPQRWIVKANWKLGAMNFAADGPHAASVHGPITYLTFAVPQEAIVQALMTSPAIVMGNGHNGIIVHTAPEAPDYVGYPPELLPLYKKTLNPIQEKFMARALTKVMTTFPNTSWVESSVRFDSKLPPITFCNLRTWQPLSAQRTEIWNWLLAEKEAAAGYKQASYEMGLRTFSVGGTFDQDDAESWSSITLGSRGTIGSSFPVDFRATQAYRDHPMTDFPGPGVAYPSTYSEMSEFAVLVHWQKLMREGGA